MIVCNAQVHMEISAIKDISLRIKTKNASIVTNPSSKVTSDIVILTSDLPSIDLEKVEGAKLIIEGPGEYEASGVRITGFELNQDIAYIIEADNIRVLLIKSSDLPDLKEDNAYSAIAIQLDESIKDQGFESFPSDLFILFGEENKVSLNGEEVRKLPKVNLRKREDIGSSVVFLTS